MYHPHVTVPGVSLTETPLNTYPPWTETPWTETPQTEIPFTETPLDGDPPGQKPSLDRDPPDRDPIGQRPPLTETPRLWTETPAVNRITDRCKNITFPQLRLHAVMSRFLTCKGCFSLRKLMPSSPNASYRFVTISFSRFLIARMLSVAVSLILSSASFNSPSHLDRL